MDRSFGDPHQVFRFPRFVAIATIHSPGRVRSKTCLFVDELNGPDNEKKKRGYRPTDRRTDTPLNIDYNNLMRAQIYLSKYFGITLNQDCVLYLVSNCATQ